MKFYSTHNKKHMAGLEEALINGLAPDGGLYMPCRLPIFSKDFFINESFNGISFEIAKHFFSPEIPEVTLKNIVQEAFNFEVPVVKLNDRVSVLELFHGPTCAFKDFAARFMARVFGFFAETSRKEITILVATSGDTGSAIAHGFLGVSGIKVIILYPSKKVSPLQEKQLTGMGQNITALEVDGSFDDCQKLVKQAFLDQNLRKQIALASANSINIARLLPQSFYYAYACSRYYNQKKGPIVVSVPSGNFGNLTAGIIAKNMGVPISKFVASTNKNDVVPRYLNTGKYYPTPSIATISNAMDVGSPSNFSRILELYQGDLEKIRNDIYGASFSDGVTREAIKKVFDEYDYILDPHGAVAYLGLRNFLNKNPRYAGIFLESASPAKFFEEVEKSINVPVPMPDRLGDYLNREKQTIPLDNNYDRLKDVLLRK